MRKDRRPNAKRRPKKPAPPPEAASRHAGFYMQLARRSTKAHPDGWPPKFVAQLGNIEARHSTGLTHSETSAKSRQEGLAAGKEYATGTIAIGNNPRASKTVGWIK